MKNFVNVISLAKFILSDELVPAFTVASLMGGTSASFTTFPSFLATIGGLWCGDCIEADEVNSGARRHRIDPFVSGRLSTRGDRDGQ